MRGLLGAFFAEVGLITYRSVKRGGVSVRETAPLPMPLPSEYTSAVLVYGALTFLPKASAPVPSLIGWGLVLATLLNLWEPGGKVKPSTTVATPQLPKPATLA